MAGPWEKYQQTGTAVSGPWNKFSSAPVVPPSGMTPEQLAYQQARSAGAIPAPIAQSPADAQRQEQINASVQPDMLAPASQGAVSGISLPNILAQFGVGSQGGIAQMAGLPVDAVTGAINGVGELTGMWNPIQNPVGGSESIGALFAPLNENVPAPQNMLERGARRVGQEVGASAALGPLAMAAPAVRAAPLPYVATEAASAIGGGTGAAIANEIAPGSATAEIIGQLAGGLPAGYAAGRQFDTDPIDKLRSADVSGDELTLQAGRLYDDAAANGVTAPQAATQGLAGDVRAIASKEGLISPTGRIAESYPKIKDAINMVDDFAKGEMTPDQMQAVRRTFQNAARSADPAESRVGTIMLGKFDDFVEPLAPQFKEANKLYRRAMLGKTMDETADLADARASQFSGSGLENAMRTEYRALDRKIIKGQMKGLSPDQEAAIRQVTRGGPVENTLRGLGKAAPTGVVSAGMGAGVPFLIGNAIGGPVLGAIAGAGTLGGSAIARKLAETMGMTNMEMAELLMRSADGKMPDGVKAGMSKVAAALLGVRAAGGSDE